MTKWGDMDELKTHLTELEARISRLMEHL